jgi:hypothetical protein
MLELKFMRGALFALLLAFAHAELPAKPQSECGVYECKGISIRPDGIVCREKGKPFTSCSFALEDPIASKSIPYCGATISQDIQVMGPYNLLKR